MTTRSVCFSSLKISLCFFFLLMNIFRSTQSLSKLCQNIACVFHLHLIFLPPETLRPKRGCVCSLFFIDFSFECWICALYPRKRPHSRPQASINMFGAKQMTPVQAQLLRKFSSNWLLIYLKTGLCDQDTGNRFPLTATHSFVLLVKFQHRLQNLT